MTRQEAGAKGAEGHREAIVERHRIEREMESVSIRSRGGYGLWEAELPSGEIIFGLGEREIRCRVVSALMGKSA